MRKTLFAILLALALVMIPVGSAFAADPTDGDGNRYPGRYSVSPTHPELGSKWHYHAGEPDSSGTPPTTPTRLG